MCGLQNLYFNDLGLTIPSYVVVDKFERVRFINSKIQLSKLLEEQESKYIKKIYTKLIHQENKDSLCDYLNSNQISQITKDFGSPNTFEFNAKFQEVESQGTNLQISYFIRQKKQEKFNIFLDKVLSFFPENSNEIKREISKTIDIPFPGIECVLCKKPLNDLVQQYYSPYKNQFFFCQCAEYDDKTQKGLNRYKCTDNLIFINAPLNDKSVLFDIDDYKRGKNLKLAPGQQGNQKPNIMCNGNHKFKHMEVGPRYISLNAKPGKLRDDGYVDYCQGCFQILKNKNSPQAINLVNRNIQDGMVSDGLLLRILFKLGYYDF